MFSISTRISYKQKHRTILSVFIVLALFIIAAAHYGTQTLSAVRAFTDGEGKWTKAQKEATQLLMQYSIYEEPTYYHQFQNKLEVQEEFEKARKTLLSDNPDFEVATAGFQTGNLHPQDIELLVWTLYYFNDIEYLYNAIDVWQQGDQKIAELNELAADLHKDIQSGSLSEENRNTYLEKIATLDQQLTQLEKAFSAHMGEAGRWLHDIIFWSIVGMSAFLIITGYLITSMYFRETSTLNKQLSESENRYRKVLQYSRDVIYQLDFKSGRYEYMSPHVEQMLGYPAERILGEDKNFILDRVHPEDLKRMQQELNEMKGEGVEDHFASQTEFRIKTKDGNYIWVNNQRSLVEDENGTPIAIVGSVRDISERKKHEVETKKSLKEKQTLLEEIHHRVKNNLAVVSSLLELQKNESNGPVKATLKDTQSRIHSIAMIHEKLYQTETLSEINIKEYIEDFAKMIGDTHSSNQQNIAIHKELQSFHLDITKAVPLGLICNELLNNAFKHAFDKTTSGDINITLRRTNGNATFAIADNGRGLPEDFSIHDTHSMGMTLVKTLTKQLSGKIDVKRDEWSIFRITFPIS